MFKPDKDLEELGKYNSPCKDCGGICCKSLGCHFSPSDFNEITFEHLKEQIEKGYISIDRWEGDPREYIDDGYEYHHVWFLRMRNVRDRTKGNMFLSALLGSGVISNGDPEEYADIVDCSWGAGCALLTETGCPIEHDKRPMGARLLIAKGANEHCIEGYSKQQCSIDWIPYQDIMEQLVDHFINKEIEFKGYVE